MRIQVHVQGERFKNSPKLTVGELLQTFGSMWSCLHYTSLFQDFCTHLSRGCQYLWRVLCVFAGIIERHKNINKWMDWCEAICFAWRKTQKSNTTCCIWLDFYLGWSSFSRCAKLSHSNWDNGCLKYFKISILILNEWKKKKEVEGEQRLKSQKEKEKCGKDFLKSYSAESWRLPRLFVRL